MSADNWAICPRCTDLREKEIEKAQSDLDASYGQVPLAEFDDMRATVRKMREASLRSTFREDYEIYGAEEGAVRVDYHGQCSTCGLSLKFQHEHALDIGGAS